MEQFPTTKPLKSHGQEHTPPCRQHRGTRCLQNNMSSQNFSQFFGWGILKKGGGGLYQKGGMFENFSKHEINTNNFACKTCILSIWTGQTI